MRDEYDFSSNRMHGYGGHTFAGPHPEADKIGDDPYFGKKDFARHYPEG